MEVSAKRNFIVQQGFHEVPSDSCPLQYSALQFQPRVVLLWIVIAMVFKSPPAWFVMTAVLWFSALLPTFNPFDAFCNWTLGRRSGAFRLSPAPPPRRTAQAMAGAFALASGLLTYYGQMTAAYVIEGIFLAAVLALTLGGFCLGSFVYHVLRGQTQFARNTLPWAR